MSAILGWLGARTSPCREIAQLQSRAMEGQVSWLQRLDIAVHTLVCGICQRYQVQLRLLRRAVRAYGRSWAGEGAGGPGLPADARRRIAAVLRQAG